ncbi:leukotoxin LktA family filamentous adhesin, partial [Mangrovibrevibacter kandeliae]|uniref:leukotoxin LktA family filamentous adhesin n=1 Tax=Mangrovibrevibacter kandeliae TaxID=2968473 RepID=UPI0021187D7D
MAYQPRMRDVLLSCTAIAGSFAFAAPSLAQAVNIGGTGNTIIPDGRTATTASVNGNKADVRTTTVRGKVGFNSFDHFQVGGGNTVNLHLPDQTDTLVNVVRGSAVRVDGTLNAVKNAKVGGKLVFSDPYGFVVGKDGVVNTGSLMVNTPTSDFLDRAIGSNGVIDEALTDRLITGDVPISPSGSVSIKGKINALGGIAVRAQSIALDDESRLTQHREAFDSTVNTGGLDWGSELVVSGGGIRLVANGDVGLNGSISTKASGAADAAAGSGRLTVKGSRVTVGTAAKLSAAASVTDVPLPTARPAAAVDLAADGDLSVAGEVAASGSGAAGATLSATGARVTVAGTAHLSAKADGTGAPVPTPRTTALVSLAAGVGLTLDGETRATADAGADAAVSLKGNAVTLKSSGSVVASATSASGAADITLDAVQDAEVSGRLAVTRAGATGGQIAVTAGHDVTLGLLSHVDAIGSATGSGGQISVVAGHNLLAVPGADMSVKGGIAANGGSVLLSGLDGIQIAGLAADLTGGTGGAAGTLTLAPNDLTISGTYDLSGVHGDLLLLAKNALTVAAGAVIRTAHDAAHAYDVTLAGGTITIGAGATIDTRMTDGSGTAIGDSGSIRLLGHAIDIAAGATLRADSSGGYRGGDVVVAAAASGSSLFNLTTVVASVNVGGTLTGRNVTVGAYSTADSHAGDLKDAAEDFGFGQLTLGSATDIFGSMFGGFVGADTQAMVQILGTASLTASEVVTLQAHGDTVVKGDDVSASVFEVAVGQAKVRTAVDVASGAKITAGSGITLAASNALTFAVKADTNKPAAAAIAVGVVDSEARAEVHQGAVLTTGGALSIAATSTGSVSVSASANGGEDGAIGLAIAYNDASLRSIARLGSTVGTGATKPSSVTVSAVTDILKNATSATAKNGPGITDTAKRAATPARFKVLNPSGMLAGAVGAEDISEFLPTEVFRLGFGLSIAHQNHVADATIGGTSTEAAPTVRSSGNVAVFSSVYDSPIRNKTDIVIGSEKVKSDGDTNSGSGSGEEDANTAGVAVALTIGVYQHTSHATIGAGTTVEGANVGVHAVSATPLTIEYPTPDELLPDFTSFGGFTSDMKATLSNLSGAINANGGVVDKVLTSYASSTSAAKELGIAGSLDVLYIAHDAEASIGTGATVTSTGADRDGWTVALGGADAAHRGTALQQSFAAGVDVLASSTSESASIAGSPGWLGVFANSGESEKGKGGEGTSAGGSVLIDIASSRTVAAIANNAVVKSGTDVSVAANKRDMIVAVAPSSGKGSALGLTGLVSILVIDNETKAAIADTAVIEADRVRIDAQQEALAIDVTGSLMISTGSSVGLSAAWANMGADTAAYVGDVSGLGLASYKSGVAPITGSIRTNDLAVTAHTGGGLFTASVAAAVAAPKDGKPSIGDKLSSKLDTGVGQRSTTYGKKLTASAESSGKVKGFFQDKIGTLFTKVGDGISSGNTGPAEGQSREFSISATGSLSGASTQFDTRAYLDGATVTRLAATGGVGVAVVASNDLLISTTSGAGSLTLAGQDSAKASAAIGAAIAVAVSVNTTSADILNSTITNSGSVKVEALGSGQQIVLGLGVAANTNDNGIALAGSVSFGGIFDAVGASIQTSRLTGTGSQSDVAVTSYQNADIGIGGVAAAGGKGAGVGLALTATVVANQVNSYAASARIENSSLSGYRNLAVDAFAVSRILSGAGTVAISTNSLGLAGAIVFSDVSPTTLAEIRGRSTDTISVSGDVRVASGSDRRSDLEAELAKIVHYAAVDAGFDFTGAVFEFAGAPGGSLTVGFAGVVAGGKDAAGVSALYGGIRHTHQSILSGITLTAGGDVDIDARDGAAVFGSAAGIAVSNGGTIGALGSLAINLINNSTSASIEGASTVVTARNIIVNATSEGLTGGGAGSIGIATEMAGAGVSIVNNTIANTTSGTVDQARLNASGNVVVNANSKADLVTVAASLGAGFEAGVAGSIASSLALNEVHATVKGGATVSADGNVLVGALNEDSIKATAGALAVGQTAGIGLSTLVNVVRGETTARIESAAGGPVTTVVGRGNRAASQVSSGDLVNTPSYDITRLVGSLVLLTPDLSQRMASVTGVDVSAVSRQSIGASAMTGAVSADFEAIVSFSGAASPIVNVLGGLVEASVTRANVNTTGGSTANVRVMASSDTLSQSIDLNGAAATGLGAAAGLVTTVAERQTLASITDSQIGNGTASVAVVAKSRADVLTVMAGVGGGVGGAAGSLGLTVYDLVTSAKLLGGSTRASALSVTADGTTSTATASGNLAIGGAAAAGALNLTVNRSTIEALLGDAAHSTAITVAGETRVAADSHDFELDAAMGGSAAGLALTGMLNFSVVMSDTTARVANLTNSTTGSLTVTADNTLELNVATGAFNAAETGIGAAANIVLVKSLVAAEVLNGSLKVNGAARVAATADRHVTATAATAGIGSSTSIAASLNVLVLGADLPSEIAGSVQDTLNAANGEANRSLSPTEAKGDAHHKGPLGDGVAEMPGMADTAAYQPKDAVATAFATQRQDSIVARIAGATLDAGAVTVTADSKIGTENYAVGASAAAGVAVGGALGFTTIAQAVTAEASGSLTVDSLAVTATTEARSADKAAVFMTAVGGAGSVGGAFGGALAFGLIDTKTTATVGGTLTLKNGGVQVTARDTLDSTVSAGGASVAGTVAIGAAMASANKTSSVTAQTATGTVIRAKTPASGATPSSLTAVALTAASSGAMSAVSGGLAGGWFAFAGTATGANAYDQSVVAARIGNASVLTDVGSDGVKLDASATPKTSAIAVGVAVSGGGSVGASVADARSKTDVTASIGDNARITSAGAVDVLASTLLSGARSNYAQAITGSGGFYVGIQATAATALTTSAVHATVGNGAVIAASGNTVRLQASGTTRQVADAVGVSVGGLLAVGVNVATANSDTVYEAILGDGAAVGSKNLTVLAKGDDGNAVTSAAGSGGLISGLASSVQTSGTSRTTAKLGSGSDIALTGALSLHAEHLQSVAGTVTSVNASVVGGSGASASHSVNSTVQALIGAGAKVAAHDLDMAALNTTQKLFAGEASFSLRNGGTRTANPDLVTADVTSGSGGAIDAPAGVASLTVTHDTAARLGDGASVLLTSAGSDRDGARIEAYNEIIAHEKTRLDSGGLIAVANATTKFDASSVKAAVEFGTNSTLMVSNGNVAIAAWDQADIMLRAAAVTYGLAGAASGNADGTYRAANTVLLGGGARLAANSRDDLATGNVALNAGAGLAGQSGVINADARVDLFNNVALPITVTPNPQLTVSNAALVNLAAGSWLGTAGDIDLRATRGTITTSAVGVGKDIYLEALGELASGVSELFGGGKVTFDHRGGSASVTGDGEVRVDGTVLTGTQRARSLVISYAMQSTADCNVSTTACIAFDGDIGATLKAGGRIGSNILDRIVELRRMMADYGTDPVARGAFQAEIDFLEQKLIALGYSADGTGGPVGTLSDYELALQNRAALLDQIKALADEAGQAAVLDPWPKPSGYGNDWTPQSFASTNASWLQDEYATLFENLKDAVLAVVPSGEGFDRDAYLLSYDDLTYSPQVLFARTDSIAITALIQKVLDIKAQSVAPSQLLNQQIKQLAAALESGSSPSDIAGLLAQAEGTYTTLQGLLDKQKVNAKGVTDYFTAALEPLDVLRGRIQTIVSNFGPTAGNQGALSDLTNFLASFNPPTRNPDGTTSSSLPIQGPWSNIQNGILNQISTASLSISLQGARADIDKVKSAADAFQKIGSILDTLPQTNLNSPQNNAIAVGNVLARTGGIRVVADRLTGTGTLDAPGDASITITNRTANNLTVGNLTIDPNMGGHIRLNGVLVQSNADINRLNSSGTGAAFQKVEVAATQSAKPAIVISSEYDPDSLAYYDPSINPQFNNPKDSYGNPIPLPAGVTFDAGKAAANPYFFKTQDYFAPDLTVASGAKISNVAGSVGITSRVGNVYSNGTIEAGSVAITAQRGDFVQSYVYGFDHVAGDPASGVGAGLGIIANGSVTLAARYLNINGVVQSGMDARWAQIDDNFWVVVNGGDIGYGVPGAAVGRTDGSIVQINPSVRYRSANAALGTAGRFEVVSAALGTSFTNLTGTYQVAIESQGGRDIRQAIGVDYDVATQTLKVQPTVIQGGYIQIYGQVFNTSANAGELRVLDGYGQVQITNNSSKALDLGNISTGTDASGTGRGVRGVIDITDVQRIVDANAAYPVAAVKTTYTRDVVNGQYQVIKSAATGAIDKNGAFVAGTFSGNSFTAWNTGSTSYGSSRGSTYNPQTGLRYETLSGLDSSTKTSTSYEGTRFFDAPVLSIGQNVTLTRQVTEILNSYRMTDATRLVVDAGRTGTASYTTSSTIKTDANNNKNYQTVHDQWSYCIWYTACILWQYGYTADNVITNKTITTVSQKADYAIGIKFIGSDTGTIDVASKSQVSLTGALSNASGSVTVRGTDIVGTSTGSIAARDVGLTATTGSIGSAVNAVTVKATGTLSASAQGGVTLESKGALAIGTVAAGLGGDEAKVSITASGSITAANGSSYIQGPRVELVSQSGSVGSTSALLNVRLGTGAKDANTGITASSKAGLAVDAAGDIGIRSQGWSGNADGTILLDHAVSAGGDVKLVTAGAIYDNNPVETIDTRTYGELLDFWNALGLVSGTAANDARLSANIDSFQAGAAQKKQSFDAIAGAANAVFDANFAYHYSDAYKAAFAVSYRAAHPGASDAQIAAQLASGEADLTSRYFALHAELSAYSGQFSGGTYVASSAEVAKLSAGGAWTERELALSLSAGALRAVTGTNVVLKAANVSGRTVSLEAGVSLGEKTGIVTIDVGAAPSSYSDAQKIALLTAERSDFLSFADGTIRIQSVRPVNTGSGTLNLGVSGTGGGSGFAYVNSSGSLDLGSIDVAGELRLKARDSITQGAGAAPASAASYVLEAANGAIGTEAAAIRLSSPGGAVSLTARASGSINVAAIANSAQPVDLLVQTVYSRSGTAALTASGSIFSDNLDPDAVAVLGRAVRLTAGGSIGTASMRLAVGTALEGTLQATAGGAVRLGVGSGQSLVIGSVTAKTVAIAAGTPVRLVVAGPVTGESVGIDIRGSLELQAGAALTASAGDATLAAGSLGGGTGSSIVSSGTTSITTAGSMALGTIDAAQIRLFAGGSIAGGLLTARLADGILLSAGGAIDGLAVASSRLAVEAGGTVRLTARGAVLGGSIVSREGGVTLTAEQGLQLATLTAAQKIDVEGGGAVIIGTLTSSGGPVEVDAARDARFVTLAGTTLTLRSGGALGFDALTAASVTAASGAGLTLGRVTTTGDQDWQAVGDLGFTQLATTGTGGIAVASSGGQVSGGTLTSATGATVSAKTALWVANLAASGDLRLSAGGALGFDTLAAGSVTATSGAGLTLGSVTTSGDQDWTSAGDLGFGKLETTGAGGIVVASSGGRVTGGTLTSATGATVSAKTALSVDDLTAAADARLSAGSNLTTRTVTAGTLEADAGGDLGFGTVQAASLTADAGGALGFDRLTATGEATLTAGGALTGTTLSAGSAELRAASLD